MSEETKVSSSDRLNQSRASYRERVRKAHQAADERADSFRIQMLKDLGEASPIELALIASATASVRAIGLMETQIQFAPVNGRGDRKSALATSLVALQGGLLRALRQLDSTRRQHKARPKSVTELIEAHRNESKSLGATQ